MGKCVCFYSQFREFELPLIVMLLNFCEICIEFSVDKVLSVYAEGCVPKIK